MKSSTVFGLIGVTGSLVTIIAFIFGYYGIQKEGDFDLSLINKGDLVELQDNIGNLEIKYIKNPDSEPIDLINSDITIKVFSIRFRNNLREIKKEDYPSEQSPFGIQFSENVEIINAKIPETGSNSVGLKNDYNTCFKNQFTKIDQAEKYCKIGNRKPNQIFFPKVLFEKDKYIVVDIYTLVNKNKYSNTIETIGRLPRLDEGTEVKTEVKVQDSEIFNNFAGGVALVSIIIVFISQLAEFLDNDRIKAIINKVNK